MSVVTFMRPWRIFAWPMAVVVSAPGFLTIWHVVMWVYYPQLEGYVPAYFAIVLEGGVIGICLIELALLLINDRIPFWRAVGIWLISLALGGIAAGGLMWFMIRLLFGNTMSLELTLLSLPVTCFVGFLFAFLILRFEEAPNHR